MKFSEWIPELARRIAVDQSFALYDQEAAYHAERMQKSLTQEQMEILRDYLDCIEDMALLRMIYAYNLGVEQGCTLGSEKGSSFK